MQIQFDPRDRDSCASVLAVIATLQPDLSFGNLGNAPTPTAGTATEVAGFTPASTLAPAAAADSDDGPDAAAAFGEPGKPPVSPAETTGAATTPTPPPADSQVELDADGLPWDGRIHSGPEDKRPKNADGRWRRKRGVDDAEVERVTGELRQVMGAPAPAPTPAAAGTPPPPPAAASPEPAPAAVPTPAPAAPPPTPPAADTASGPAGATTADSAPPAPPTPPAASAPAANFAELMKKVTARQTAGTLTVADTKAAAEALGLTGVADLLKRPDLIAAFEAALPGEAA